ncbi:MAG TPA: cytochrome c [Steroidobacteraceae bacterium]|nr:cytochrome c [Steroidobacteraceae bacterium]
MRKPALTPALAPARTRALRVALGSASLLLMFSAYALSAYADSPLLTSRSTLGSLSGEQIYDHICLGCHMPGGQGAVGAGSYPKLAANKKFVSWRFVALTVLDGRNGMPPFGYPSGSRMDSGPAHLSDAQIADVVNYVRTHFGNEYKAEVTAEQISSLPHPAAELIGPQ